MFIQSVESVLWRVEGVGEVVTPQGVLEDGVGDLIGQHPRHPPLILVM